MKKILAIILALATAFACCGCFGSDAQQSAAPGEMGEMRGGNRGNGGFPGDMGTMGVTGTQSEIPEGGYAVIGTVQEIVGNEVTLLVSSRTNAGDKADDDSKQQAEGRPEGMGGSSRPEHPEGTNGGSRPERPEGMGSGFRPEPPEGMSAPPEAAPAGDSAEAAGETVQPADGESDAEAEDDEETLVCLLPVGMRIGQGDFSTVKTGNTLRIVYGASGVIVAVDTL